MKRHLALYSQIKKYKRRKDVSRGVADHRILADRLQLKRLTKLNQITLRSESSACNSQYDVALSSPKFAEMADIISSLNQVSKKPRQIVTQH